MYHKYHTKNLLSSHFFKLVTDTATKLCLSGNNLSNHVQKWMLEFFSKSESGQ